MLSLLHCLTIIFAALVVFTFSKRNKNPAPGPRGIFGLGNILQFLGDPIETLKRFCDQYGPMLNLNICGYKLLFLNDANYIREMFNETAFIGKPIHIILMVLSNGPWGVVSTEGEAWEAHRRFTLRGLKDCGGFCKNSMEGLIMDEVSEILEWFKENDGKTVSVADRFFSSVSNALWRIISGQRNQTGSKICSIMHDLLRNVNKTFQRGLFICPWFRHIAPDWSGYNELMNTIEGLHGFISKAVDEHVQTIVAHNPRDLIDLYLDELRNAEPGSPFYKEAGERHMVATITDLFVAGNETTAVTITWAMLYLSCHPEIQDTLHKEIDAIVGPNRLPMLADRSKMHFTEAVIQEVLRMSQLLPFGVPHRAVRDETFKGYLIEKDTVLIPHLQYILENKNVWGDPENFRPNRYLSEDGSTFINNENSIPFSAGKRKCLGFSLAETTLFLFLSSIFQQFEILPEPENPKPDLSKVLGLTNSPKPFKVLLKLRNI